MKKIPVSELKCPRCAAKSVRVIDSREAPNNRLRRRRKCNACGYRCTGYERHSNYELEIQWEKANE